MTMNLARNFLSMYDACKQSQSPDVCRRTVAAAVPTVVDTYLRSYDVCLRAFPPATCSKLFAPAQTPRATKIRWFGAGFVVAFLLRKLL